VEARIAHYVAGACPTSLSAGPWLAAEFISVEAWIAHYVAGACPTSLSAGPWLAAEFISVEARIQHRPEFSFTNLWHSWLGNGGLLNRARLLAAVPKPLAWREK